MASAEPLDPNWNIYQRISWVQKGIGEIAKDRRNDQQGYSFRGIDQVLNHCGPKLAESGIVAIPTYEEVAHERIKTVTQAGKDRHDVFVRLKLSLELVAPDGSKVTLTTIGEAMDFGGDKATNKAMSAAYKYALLLGLVIPVESKDVEDADGDRKQIEECPNCKHALIWSDEQNHYFCWKKEGGCGLQFDADLNPWSKPKRAAPELSVEKTIKDLYKDYCRQLGVIGIKHPLMMRASEIWQYCDPGLDKAKLMLWAETHRDAKSGQAIDEAMIDQALAQGDSFDKALLILGADDAAQHGEIKHPAKTPSLATREMPDDRKPVDPHTGRSAQAKTADPVAPEKQDGKSPVPTGDPAKLDLPEPLKPHGSSAGDAAAAIGERLANKAMVSPTVALGPIYEKAVREAEEKKKSDTPVVVPEKVAAPPTSETQPAAKPSPESYKFVLDLIENELKGAKTLEDLAETHQLIMSAMKNKELPYSEIDRLGKMHDTLKAKFKKEAAPKESPQQKPDPAPAKETAATGGKKEGLF